MPLAVKASGRFELKPGDVWWTHEGHFPYLIRRQDELMGFALVRRGSRVTGESDVMDVAEFFILRGARGRGAGRSAAHAIFGAFPGAWEVRVRRANAAALRFWCSVIETWVGHAVSSSPLCIDGNDWDVLRFEASSQPL